ncbi:MAG: preprotein translocase subunit SecE [Candidatus Jacksonbacteria bacterium]
MFNQITSYLISSKEELKKVTWPSRDETIQKTVLVIAISLAVAVYLGMLDYLLTRLLEKIV